MKGPRIRRERSRRHRYWKKFPEFATITTTYEELEPIFSTRDGIVEDILDTGV